MARIRAVLNRASASQRTEDVIRYEGLEINFTAREVKSIKEGLKRTGGYCPCRIQRTEENKSFQTPCLTPDVPDI